MAATSAVYFNTGKTNMDGTHPIQIRVTFTRKIKRYASIANIKFADWDAEKLQVKSKDPRSRTINGEIKRMDLLAFDLVVEYNKGISGVSQEQVMNQLRGKKAPENFFEFLSVYVEEYKAAKKYDEASSLESKGKNIWHCLHGKAFPLKATKEIKFGSESIFRKVPIGDVPFIQIDDTKLRKLDTFLKVQKEQSERSIFNHMVLIRTVFNRALTAKVIKVDVYPFAKYKLTMPESEKIPLNKEEIIRWEAVEIPDAKTDNWLHAKYAWLFSFAFGGARISDVLQTHWDDIYDGQLHYVMGKNNKPVAIEIPARGLKVLNYYKQFGKENKGFVFPALKDADLSDIVDIKRKIKNAVRLYSKWHKKIAKEAKIKKDVSPHNARHSFGEAAGDLISPQLLQRIYRHARISTSMNYQQHWMDQAKLNKAVAMVVDF